LRLARTLALCCCLSLAILALAGSASARTPRESTAAMLKQVNKARAKRGLRPMRLSPSLTRSARRFSHHLMATDRFAHSARIQASGRFHRLGEALAMHSGRRDKVGPTVRQWLNSPPHRAIVLSRSLRWLGAGVTHGRFGGSKSTIWVLQAGTL
jgi:uncharacterized protein YkwD